MSARAAACAVLLVVLPAAAQEPIAPAAPASPPAPGAQPPAVAPADPQGAATAAAAAVEPQGAATAAPGGSAAAAASGADISAPSRMVALPSGRFQGAERVGVNQDAIFYRVGPFFLDATEVTVAQYAACVRAKRCKPAGTAVDSEGLNKADQKKWSAACNGERPDRADHPVNCVDWYQASDYCAWAGKRLPAEEEFEWAARGASAGGIYPWGEEAPEDRACWGGEAVDGGRRTGTCPVGSHPRGNSPEGISDLAGNVWEWTSTQEVLYPDSRGRGGAPANVARGGGWADKDPHRLTAGRRAKDRPQWRLADLGFRCARSP